MILNWLVDPNTEEDRAICCACRWSKYPKVEVRALSSLTDTPCDECKRVTMGKRELEILEVLALRLTREELEEVFVRSRAGTMAALWPTIGRLIDKGLLKHKCGSTSQGGRPFNPTPLGMSYCDGGRWGLSRY